MGQSSDAMQRRQCGCIMRNPCTGQMYMCLYYTTSDMLGHQDEATRYTIPGTAPWQSRSSAGALFDQPAPSHLCS